MRLFRNDYSETAPRAVLQALLDAEGEQNTGYGEDVHTAKAAELIKKRFGVPDGEVHLLTGGTQTNMTVISFLLRPYEGVIACETAHINVHETAAVEGSGHKVFTCPSRDGKLAAEDIEKAAAYNCDEHMVKPAMVYISDSTETGTVYTRAELAAIREVCDRHGFLLFIDGARLGTALTCGENDVDAELIGSVADVFYVGGTKNGLLSGEAVVFRDKRLAKDFRYHIKNRGAMLAKGFVLGIQFETLFAPDERGGCLYFDLAASANRTARYVKTGISELIRNGKSDLSLEGSSPTNQIFIRLPLQKAEQLTERFGCERWSDCGENRVVRIVTSFATKEEDCRELLDYLAAL